MDDDTYVNTYYYFIKALELLSSDADAQCEEMDNFNVAWEIKSDTVNKASAILEMSDDHLSEMHRGMIKKLLHNVQSIPDTVIKVPNLQDAHRKSMNNQTWGLLRAQAKQLIAVLSGETERVNAILNAGRSQ